MMRVTLELCPGGDVSRARHLGTAFITNTGTGTEAVGNYRVKLSKCGSAPLTTLSLSKGGRPTEAWKTGEVLNFPRRRLGAWDLLGIALVTVLGKRIRRTLNDQGE